MSACTSESSYHKISAQEAKEMMDTQDVVIVDVRTQEEYNEGYIENAILIPNESISGAPSELPDKDAVILIYCRSGNRSKSASNLLVKQGFTHIFDFGGLNTWKYGIVK